MTPLIQQYLDIKKNHENAILLFRLGDFYEMFFEDAELASKVLDIALTSRDKRSENPVPLCGFPHHSADPYITKLLDHGHKVAICEQIEDPKETKGIVRREVVRVITPALRTENEGLPPREDNPLVSISGDGKCFALCWLDVSTGRFEICQLNKVDELLSEVMRLAPKEILLSSVCDEQKELKEGLYKYQENQSHVRIEVLDSAIYHGAEQKLCQRFDVARLEGLGFDQQALMAEATMAILYYVEDLNRTTMSYLLPPKPYALNDLLYLDATTAEHLELFSTKSSLASSHHLFEVLDKTMTSMGSRQLRRWMQCPLKDIKKIRVRQDAIEELVEKVDTRKKLRDILKGVYDMERLITRIASQRSNARDLIALRTSLHHVLQVGREMNNLDSLLLSEVKLNLEVDQDFLKLMDQMLCEDPPFSVREGGMFNPGVSRELDEYRLAKTNGKQWLSALEAKERQTTGISTLKIRYNRVFGYFLEVTKGQISKVPSSYERRQTLTNAERYITPELKEYESKILSAEEKIQQIEYDLFEHLREQVMGKRGAIGQIAKGLSTLDVLLSLAEVADQNAYTRPVVSENQILDIQDGRHPIVEAFVRTEAFVPNSLKLNADTRLVILTGPNMAGKSTIMRQMALIIYMAQLGSFVPATAAHIGVVDRIFTRVGASDDLSRGRSTFMVEMNEAANILRNATKNSFVVLDEIGRGTSTYDGLAIAWAVAEDLHDRIQCKAIFATHYHELTELAAKKPAIHNLNVAIKEWQGELIFIRKLAEGAVSRSYGIEVAKMAGVPHQVVERAKSVMKAFENVEAVPVNEDAKQIPTPKASQEEWLEDLFKVDCHTMTPLEAINLISIWQKRYKK